MAFGASNQQIVPNQTEKVPNQKVRLNATSDI